MTVTFYIYLIVILFFITEQIILFGIREGVRWINTLSSPKLKSISIYQTYKNAKTFPQLHFNSDLNKVRPILESLSLVKLRLLGVTPSFRAPTIFPSLSQLLLKECKWDGGFSTFFSNFFPSLKILHVHKCKISVWFLKNLLVFNGHKIETLSLVDVEAFLTTAEYKTTPNKKSRLKMRQGKKKLSSYTNNANFAEDNFEEYAEIVENSETDNLLLSDKQGKDVAWVKEFCSRMEIPVVFKKEETQDEMIIQEVVLIRKSDGDGDSWTKDGSKNGEEIFFKTCKLDLFFENCSDIMKYDCV